MPGASPVDEVPAPAEHAAEDLHEEGERVASMSAGGEQRASLVERLGVTGGAPLRVDEPSVGHLEPVLSRQPHATLRRRRGREVGHDRRP